MAYGITSQAQIIDLNTIIAGANQLKTALEDFGRSGNAVIAAGETCTKKALSIDDSTLEISITDLGNEIKNLKGQLGVAVDEFVNQARQVYNQQVAEYNEYVRQQQLLQQQRAQQAAQGNN